jgi:hypothetical protein
MPVKTSELVKNLLKKAGITHDGEIGEELPDEVATQLDNSLLTLQAATNNHPQVKKVYFAQAYNGLDAELESLSNEYGLDDETKAALKAETSSTKRAVNLVKKIKELSTKKDESPDAGKAAKLQNEINDLHKQLKTEQDNITNIKKEYEGKLKSLDVKYRLDSLLSGYKTVYDELPTEAKQAAVNSLLSKALQDSDAEFTFDEKGNLSLVKKDGTNLFGDNHTQLTPQSFIDKTLSKILKVTETSPASNGNIQTNTVQSGQNAGNPALKAVLSESLKNYQEASKSAAVSG